MEPDEKKDVRHGCVDCVYYPLPGGKEPCKSCRNWSAWKDKQEGQDGTADI